MAQFKYGTIQIWRNSNMAQFKYGAIQIWHNSNMAQFKYGAIEFRCGWDSVRIIN